MSFPGDNILIYFEFFCLAQKKYCTYLKEIMDNKNHNYQHTDMCSVNHKLFFFML